MNNVNIIGRITKDLEVRQVGGDNSVLSFAIAVNERRGQQDETSFFDITAWGKQAETIAQYFRKGQRIGVSGKLQQQRWQDKDGGNRSRVVIVLREFEFIEPKEGGKQDNNQKGGDYPQNPEYTGGFDDFPEDGEVPF